MTTFTYYDDLAEEIVDVRRFPVRDDGNGRSRVHIEFTFRGAQFGITEPRGRHLSDDMQSKRWIAARYWPLFNLKREPTREPALATNIRELPFPEDDAGSASPLG